MTFFCPNRRSLLASALLLAAALLCAACGGGDGVPTCRVEQRPLEHRVTAEGNLKAERITVVAVPPEVQEMVRLAWIAPDGIRVAEGDVVARFDPGAMEQRLQEGENELATATLDVDKMQAESNSALRSLATDLQMADLELDLARRFLKTDDIVFSRHEIIESEIDEKLASERKQHATDSRVIQESLARTNLELVEIRRRKAQLKIDQASSGLHALEVRAPHAGLLTLRRDWRGEPPQIGADMWKGQEIAQIPDLSKMQAEVFVLEADAGGLEVGKPATVVIEAHPEHQYHAVIRRVEAVAKPRVRSSPVQYFGVVLELESTDPEVMKPGHRVRATLLLQDLPEALVVPRQAVHEKDGEHLVYVRSGRRFHARTVRIVAASMGLLAIAGEVAAGDIVALREPPDLDRGAQAHQAAASEVAAGAGLGTCRVGADKVRVGQAERGTR